MSLPPATFAGSALRAHEHEVVVHDVAPVDARSPRRRTCPRRPGRARTRRRRRRAGPRPAPGPVPSATTLTAMPVLAGELRQEVAEQPGLLGGGRRGDDDRPVLRVRRAGERGGGQGEDGESAAGQRHGNSPFRNASASAEAGARKKRSTAERSTRRPRSRKSTSSPRRCAWPRLWVTSTIFVPRGVDRLHDGLDLARGPRVEVRGGLVEEEHLGLEHPRARQREALLLAAGEHARRPLGEGLQADALQRRTHARLAHVRRHACHCEGEQQVVAHAPAQQHRPLEHHGLAPRGATPLGMGPAHAARSRREQAVAQAQQDALARAVGPEDHGARAGVEHEVDALEDRAPAGRVADLLEGERQQRLRALSHGRGPAARARGARRC